MSAIPHGPGMHRPPPRRRMPVCVPVTFVKPPFNALDPLDIMLGTCWWLWHGGISNRRVNYKEIARRRKRNKVARRSRRAQGISG